MPMGFALPPSPLVQGEGRCPFPSLPQKRQLLRGEQELDPRPQVPGLSTVRYQGSARSPSAAEDPACPACQHPPALHGPPREGPDREAPLRSAPHIGLTCSGALDQRARGQQDPEEIPASPNSPAPTPAGTRGQ